MADISKISNSIRNRVRNSIRRLDESTTLDEKVGGAIKRTWQGTPQQQANRQAFRSGLGDIANATKQSYIDTFRNPRNDPSFNTQTPQRQAVRTMNYQSPRLMTSIAGAGKIGQAATSVRGLIGLGVMPTIGGGINKAVGGSFREGFTNTAKDLPQIYGLTSMTTPAIDKLFSPVANKFTNPIAGGIAGRTVQGLANIPEGVAINQAINRPEYSLGEAGFDFVTGFATGGADLPASAKGLESVRNDQLKESAQTILNRIKINRANGLKDTHRTQKALTKEYNKILDQMARNRKLGLSMGITDTVKVGKQTDPLFKEAKKYKSAEELPFKFEKTMSTWDPDKVSNKRYDLNISDNRTAVISYDGNTKKYYVIDVVGGKQNNVGEFRTLKEAKNKVFTDIYNKAQEPVLKVKQTDPLLEEARKYKSAEEFVRGIQDRRKSVGRLNDVVFHETTDKSANKIYSGGFKTGKELGVGEATNAVYGAQIFDNVSYVRGDKGARIPIDISSIKSLDVGTLKKDPSLKSFEQPDYTTMRNAEDGIFPSGYDAVYRGGKDGKISEIAIKPEIATKNILTKSQLTDIYNKAKGIKTPKQAFGAIAGVEYERDENGNITGIKYDPVKGAIGVGAMAGYTKIKGSDDLKGILNYQDKLVKSGVPLDEAEKISYKAYKEAGGNIEKILSNAGKKIGEEKSIKKGAKQTWKDFYTQWVNRDAPIERLVDTIEKKKNISILPKDNPKYTIKRLLGAGGVAEQRHQKELQPILNKLDELNVEKRDFDVFLKAKRDLELGARGVKGSDPQEAKGIITALGEKYNVNQLDEIAQGLYSYQDKSLNMLRDSGFISDEAYTKIKTANQNYVPFERVMGDELENYLGLPTNVRQNPTSPIKTIKGSDRQIYSPIESIIANTYKVEAAVSKNNVAKSVVNLRKVSKEFENLFTPSSKSGDNAIAVWENGKKQYYNADKDVAEAIKGMNEEQANLVVSILTVPAKILRQQATGRNLEFMLPNVIRDQLDATINAKYGYRPFVDYFVGLGHLLKHKYGGGDKLVDDWIANGGKIFFDSMSGRKAVQQQITEAESKNLIKKVGNWVVGGIDAIGDVSETPTRIGLYNRAYKKTGNKMIAAYESREGTLDFARMGGKMKVANSIVPFLNVSVQGFDKMLRSAKDRPAKTAFLLATYGALPAIATTLYNITTHKDEYESVPDFEKDDNFILMTGGEDPQGNPTYLKIPKGHVVSVVANPTQRLLEYISGANPQTFGQFATSFLSSTLPVVGDGSNPKEVLSNTVGSNLPQAFKVPVEHLANYSFYKSKPIVPSYLQNKEPSEQYTKYTPEMYKRLGGAMNMSPMKLQNTIESTFAGGVKQPQNIVNTLQMATGNKEFDPNKVFVGRRFYGSYSGFDNERPQSSNGGIKLGKLFGGDKVSASDTTPLPTSTKDLSIVYNDVEKTINSYNDKKVKILYNPEYDQATKDTKLQELQDEMDTAIAFRKQIEAERPEQLFDIGVETYNKDGGQSSEDRGDWVIKQLESVKDDDTKLEETINKLYEGQVLTKSVVEYLNSQGFNISKYNYGTGFRYLSGGGSGSSKKSSPRLKGVSNTVKIGKTSSTPYYSKNPFRLSSKKSPSITIGSLTTTPKNVISASELKALANPTIKLSSYK